MFRSRKTPLASFIALIVSSGVSLQVLGAEIFIQQPTFAPQQLWNVDRLTIERLGSIMTTGPAITLNNGGFIPSVNVTNAGTIISSNGRAIDTLDTPNTTGYYTITNQASGLIHGDDDAIRINNSSPHGYLTIVNSGTISSTRGQGLNLDALQRGERYITAMVTNEQGGVIHSDSNAGMTTGNNVWITNNGEISSGNALSSFDNFDGIDMRAATGTTITNYGVVSGGRHGVSTLADGLLNNFGTVIGRNDAGFASEGESTLYNQGGVIVGGANTERSTGDGDGVRIAGVGDVSNWGGIIRGEGASGLDRHGNARTSEGVMLGGGYLRNGPGAFISGANNGVLIGSERNADGAALASTWMSNFGTILGLNGYGVKFIGEFDDYLLNNGLISGSNGLALNMGGGDDTLEVYSNGRFDGIVDGGSGHDTVLLGSRYDYMGHGTFGPSRNFESLQVVGGTWTLTGGNDFNDSRVLQGAQLINQSSINGTVDVDPWATYSGSGTVGTLNLDGILRINDELGAPRVTGDLNLGNQAQIEFGVNPDGSSGTIRVGGIAYLNDATLWINPGTGDYPWHSQYVVLEANQIVGRFEQPQGYYYAFLTPELSYTSTSVSVTLTRNDVDMREYATSTNSRRLATSIQPRFNWWQPEPTGSLYDALLYTSTDTASAALEQLAGSGNANLGAAILGSGSPVAASMLSAMYQMGSGAGLTLALDPVQAPSIAASGVPSALRNLNGPNARGRVWLQAIGGHGRLDGSHGSAGLEQRSKGTLLGVDWALDESWRVGVLGGYSQTDLDSGADDGRLDSWHAGLYALRQSGLLAIRLGAAYSRHDGESKRHIEFARFTDQPKGDYAADSQQAFVELGYNLGSGRLDIEPFANLGYQRYHRDSYREKGGIAALAVDAQAQDNYSTTFGMRLAHLGQLYKGISLTPRASIGWRHVYGNVDSEVRQSFVSGGNAFNIEGTALDRDSLMLEAGLGIGLSARHSLNLGYSGELGSDSRNQSLTAQWQVSF